MSEAFVSAYPVAGKGVSPKVGLRRIACGWRWVLKGLMVSAAVALLICPDPFTDVLAFGLMAKAGVSMNFKALARRMKHFLHLNLSSRGKLSKAST